MALTLFKRMDVDGEIVLQTEEVGTRKELLVRLTELLCAAEQDESNMPMEIGIQINKPIGGLDYDGVEWL